MAAPGVRPITIPGDFTVWAGSDLHGQLEAVDALLLEAGISDGPGRWTAPPRTALVVCGDVVDRGPDSLGLVRRLVALRDVAAARGGMVAILEGNHEAQVLGGLAGVPAVYRAFIAFGGGATLASAGLDPSEWAHDGHAEEIARRVATLAPDLVPLLLTFAPFARWGDVLFVHAGPFPEASSLAEFEARAERLWIRDRFFASPDAFPDAPAWTLYREAGIRRVVFGHTPVEAPTLCHDGNALNLDTWRGRRLTLARLEPGAPLADATFLSTPTQPRAVADAPITLDEIRRLDAELPGIIDAWSAGKYHR